MAEDNCNLVSLTCRYSNLADVVKKPEDSPGTFAELPKVITTTVPEVTVSQHHQSIENMLEFSRAPSYNQDLSADPLLLSTGSSFGSLPSQGAVSKPIRSHSLTPMVSGHQQGGDNCSGWGAKPIIKNRSYSLTSGLREQTNEREIREQSGMKDLRDWMKSLRLHKYTERLIGLTYEEFMSLSDENLKERLFTNGAKGKFLKQIALIRDRPHKIREIRQQLDDIIDLKELLNILVDLEKLILMPLKPTVVKPATATLGSTSSGIGEVQTRAPNVTISELSKSEHHRHDSGSDSGTEMAEEVAEDIPQELFDLLEKSFSIIICKQKDDCDKDRVVLTFYKLLQMRCLKKEAFTNSHKQLFHTWIKRMDQVWDISKSPLDITGIEGKRRYERSSSRDQSYRRGSLQPPMPQPFLRGPVPAPPYIPNVMPPTTGANLPVTCSGSSIPCMGGIYPVADVCSSTAMTVQRRSVPDIINPPNSGHQIKRNSYQGDQRMPPLFDSAILSNVYEGQQQQQQKQQHQQQQQQNRHSMFCHSPYLSHSTSFSSSSSSQSRRESTLSMSSWDSGFSRRSSTMSGCSAEELISRRNSSISGEFNPPQSHPQLLHQQSLTAEGTRRNSSLASHEGSFLSVEAARRHSAMAGSVNRLTPSSGCPSDDGSTDSLEHDLHKLSLSVTESLLE